MRTLACLGNNDGDDGCTALSTYEQLIFVMANRMQRRVLGGHKTCVVVVTK